MQITEWVYISPELWLIGMTLITLIVSLYAFPGSKWITYSFCQAALIGALFFMVNLIEKSPYRLFNNMFIVDYLGTLLKFFVCLVGYFVFLYSRKYIFENNAYRSEYFILCLFSILGMMVLISAGNFLSLYLGIELLALPLYALITLKQEDDKAPEAAMKYFVMGAVASGLLLYGISLLYGITGSFEMEKIATGIQAEHPSLVLLFSLIFIVAGLAFKFGAAPFHMWLPDVYQGAPISVTLFIGTLPKLAAFGFAIRVLLETFPTLGAYWQWLFILMAILSLGVGNLAAMVQSNLKRMLAYSAIAHIGFLFLGLLTGSQGGFAAALDYSIIYSLMALGALGIITALSYQGFEAQAIQDFGGLRVRHPWLAFLMTLLLLSLAGIPPFAGFYAKLFIINALIDAGYVWLSVLALLFTVIGAYYYLRIIRVMYFDEPIDNTQFREISNSGIALLSLNGLAILLLGLFPAPLLNICMAVLSIHI